MTVRFSSLTLAGAALLSANAVSAEEASNLSYKASMRCMTLYGLLGAAVEEEEEATPEDIAFHEDKMTRWMILAMMRDGEEGKRTIRDIEPAMDGLAAKIDSFGDDQKASEAYITGLDETCQALQKANAKEFEAVDVDAINAEEEEVQPAK